MSDAEIDAILSDFRDWLKRIPSVPPPTPPHEKVDLSTVVRGFTALRQEVNLQTRAVRTQSEQAAKMLDSLSSLNGEPAAEQPFDPRPLFKAILDARDSLALALGHVSKSRGAIATNSRPEVTLSLPGWTHWLGLDAAIRQAMQPLEDWSKSAAAALAHVTPAVESLFTGYSMSLQRLDRAIEQCGLRRIECVGKPFDSETMEVVEVVADATRSTSEVLEEVRPGYWLNGTVFRFAQVRVAKPA